MPLYEYLCKKCGEGFTLTMTISEHDKKRVQCPRCNGTEVEPRSASNSSTSRYEREKRKYHPTARRIISGSNCRHLNRPQTEEASRSIQPTYHGLPPKLQHFPPDRLCGISRECSGDRRI